MRFQTPNGGHSVKAVFFGASIRFEDFVFNVQAVNQAEFGNALAQIHRFPGLAQNRGGHPPFVFILAVDKSAENFGVLIGSFVQLLKCGWRHGDESPVEGFG